MERLRIILFTVVFLCGLVSSQSQCPDDYSAGPGGNCYSFRQTTSFWPWEYARSNCATTADSDLVIINNQEEYDWIVDNTTTIAPNSSWWIGYHDSALEGDWRWVDCEETTDWQLTLWAPGNPGNGRDDCGVLLPTGEIDDIVCDTRINYFVCEISPKGFDPNEASPTNVRVTVTSTLTVSLRWDVSALNCDVFAYKIRIKDDMMETTSVIVYGGNTSEVEIAVDRVRTEYSFTVAALLILNDVELPQSEPVRATTGPCPGEYEESPGGRCYLFRDLTYGEWWMAGRRSCDNTEDGDLVIVNDEAEWNFIKNRTNDINPDTRWWIGITDLASDNDWKWVDCTESNDWQELLWGQGFPTSADGRDCAFLDPDGSLQNDVCDRRFNSICEISPKEFDLEALLVEDVMLSGLSPVSLKVTWSLPTYSCDAVGYRIYYSNMDTMDQKSFMFINGGDATEAVIQDLRANTTYYVTVAMYINKDQELDESMAVQGKTMPCPANYEEGPNGHCYWFDVPSSGYGYMWYWGRQDCMDEPDSDLVIINDEEELGFLRNRITEIANERDWWIGLINSARWEWTNCEELTPWQETLWAPGNPRPESLGCAILNETGELVDVNCDDKHNYICEIYSKGFSADDQNILGLDTNPVMYGINVSWTVAPKRCDVEGYEVYYKEDREGAEEKFVVQYGEDSTSTVITDLYPNTTYSVTVQVLLNTDRKLTPVGPVQQTTLPCPDNYEEGPNRHCYRFRILDDGTRWSRGRQTCDNIADSDYVIINNEEELAFLVNRSAEIDPNMNWWIGLSDLSTPGLLSWVDCSAYQDLPEWAPSYPTTQGPICAALRPDGMMMNAGCETRFSYICEISPKGFDSDVVMVQNVAASGFSNYMNVSWVLPDNNCDATGYFIYSQLSDGSGDRKSMYIDGSESTFGFVRGLTLDTSYSISVAISTSKETVLQDTAPIEEMTTSSCPTDYEPGPNGRCYRFLLSNYGSWWPSTRFYCSYDGHFSDLLVIDDQEEYDFVMEKTMALNPNISWWIGYSDQSSEGDWRWLDCEASNAFQESLWAPGYPGNGRHDCAALRPSGDVVDLLCDILMYGYVCELASREFDWEEGSVQSLMATGIEAGLEVTWTVSPRSCDVIGYRITYQLDEEGSESEFMLVYPGDIDSVTVTALIPHTRYVVGVAAIISIDDELDPVLTTGTTLSCPNNYEEGPNGRCYRFRIPNEYGSHWPTARRTCDNVEDSDLVIINDVEEMEFLVNRTREIDANMTWWIGLSDLYIKEEWKWVDCSDATPYHSSLWAPGYPTNLSYTCVALQPGGEFINLPCDRRFSYLCEISPKGFDLESQRVSNLKATGGMYTIDVTWAYMANGCNAVGYRIYYELANGQSDVERSVYVSGGESVGGSITGLSPNSTYSIRVTIWTSKDTELEATDPVIASTDPCPNNYEEGPNGHCYRFRILEYGSWWPTGRRTCDNEVGSDLAIINDQTELDFLLNKTAEIDPEMVWWIGYSDQSVEGDWRWIDCTESTTWQEALWAPGHPGNGRLDCAALQPDGNVVDLVCDTALSYLCEIYPRGFTDEDANPHDLAAMGTTYGLEVTWTISPTSCDVVGYRISYYLTGDSSNRASVIIYGGDLSSVTIRGLAVNTTYDVTVAAFTSKDYELSPVGPVTATTDLCPDGYDLAPNGRCYYFAQASSYWHYSRQSCWSQKDSDLAIVNDQEELDYILEQITAIGDERDWWLGYSDISVEGQWKWVDCTESDDWQQNLWGLGSPGNGMLDCGALASSGEVLAQVCDMPLNFVCEVSPKGFDPAELKVENLEAAGASYGVDVSWTVQENNCDTYAYKIYYQESGSDDEEFKVIYGGDSVGARIQGLLPNTSLTISVATLVIIQDELERVGPVMGQADPCPPGYEEAANGRCYWFQDFGRYGKGNDDSRFYCYEATGKFDDDLMIINDEWELEYITNRTREFNDSRDWWIGYSDQAVEGDWKWVTCERSDPWQESLWAPGYPQNGRDDCGVFDPDTMTIYDHVCDEMSFNFICEVTPKDFSIGDDNVFNLNATATAWDTILVTWNVSEYNCDIVAYNIYYLDTYLGGDPERVWVYGADVNSYELTMLQPSTRYSISVAAERQDQRLPQVDPVYVTTPEGPCPAYYEIGPNGGCYRFVTSQYGEMWAISRGGCESVADSDLVVIDDQEELDYIVNRTKDFSSSKNWWIGFSDFSVETDWRWVTCDPPSDWQNTLWEPGYPGSGDCGALSSNSLQVIDVVCDARNYYICEITPKGFTNYDMNVRDVMSVPLSSTEIQVTWVLSNITCNVYAYKIYYGIQGEPFDITQFELAYGGNVSSKTVLGLPPGTTYEFYVAALIPDRLELPRIGPTNATTYSECERTIVDADGIINNVDFPNGYAGPETCEWLISAPAGQFILLQILDFDTQSGADFLVIGYGQDFDPDSTLYVLSGSNDSPGGTPIPAKILSAGQYLWMSFRTSEPTTEHAGFQMSVTMVAQGPGTPPRMYDEVTQEGTLTSPGWPNQYDNFMDLTWTLIGPKTGRVRITTLEGSLEPDYDTLTIGYGEPDSSIIDIYTGEFALDEFVESPSYTFWVRFQADETVSERGFMLYWESFDDQDACGTEELYEASGTVMSPNFPEPYPDNQECTWLIRLPSTDYLVRIEFTAFSLEENHDFLTVGTGRNVNEEVIAILTGESLPAPIESATYRMWLQFRSDESFSASGFSLEYTSIEHPDPPTEYNEITDTVIFIIQDESVGWFNLARQNDLATAIAAAMTDYCQDKSDTCEEISRRKRDNVGILQLTFSVDDVEFLEIVAVENDIHLTTWVRNPSMVGEDVVTGIEPDIVQTSLMEETSQVTIREAMGAEFTYDVAPNIGPTDMPTESPPEGLEPWAISLIVVASVAVIATAVVGLEVRHRKKSKTSEFDDDDGRYAEPIHGKDEPDSSGVPLNQYGSTPSTNGKNNEGFEGDNTAL